MADKKSFMKAALRDAKEIVSPPVPIVPFADWDYYYTRDTLRWRANAPIAGAISEVEVPVGFVTDLASIPSEFWSVLPPTARYSYPAIIHDYLYWFQPCERAQADAVFKAAMEDLQVATTKIVVIFNAVRLAGGSSWSANSAARLGGERRILKKYPTDVRTTWSDWREQPDVFAP